MKALQQKANKIFTLPYKERENPANELFSGLLLIGYSEKTAKRLLRNCGFSRSLLFRLNPHKHLQCLSETPVQML